MSYSTLLYSVVYTPYVTTLKGHPDILRLNTLYHTIPYGSPITCRDLLDLFSSLSLSPMAFVTSNQSSLNPSLISSSSNATGAAIIYVYRPPPYSLQAQVQAIALLPPRSPEHRGLSVPTPMNPTHHNADPACSSDQRCHRKGSTADQGTVWTVWMVACCRATRPVAVPSGFVHPAY